MIMQYNTETVAKYLWMVLIAVVIAVAVVIVFQPGETRSTCSGFQYFVFLDQKLTPSAYSLELLNGVRDVKIKSATLEGSDIGASLDVNSGDTFVINSSKNVNVKTGDSFRYRVTVEYDTSGIKDNKDSAVCTGIVQ